jgi:hypothetical protein
MNKKTVAVAVEIEKLCSRLPEYEWLTRIELNRMLFEERYKIHTSKEVTIEKDNVQFHIVTLIPFKGQGTRVEY